MATGPAHYREAERLIGLAADEAGHDENERWALRETAQVHATLALVAARLPLPRDHRAWADVLNGEPG